MLKVNRVEAWTCPKCSMSLRFQRNIPGTQRIRRPQGHSAAGRITSMKNSNDTIGNRTCDLLACSAVPQPTAPLHAPNTAVHCTLYLCQSLSNFTQKAVWMRHKAVKAQVKRGDYWPCELSNYVGCTVHFPVLVALWSKAKVCSYSIAGIMGLNLAEGVCLLCVV
jgi:hypothetical protein